MKKTNKIGKKSGKNTDGGQYCHVMLSGLIAYFHIWKVRLC
jgi:hypothetical protein